jgi:hypothetical protein
MSDYSIMVKKQNPNKIFDKFTGRQISVATATKRLKSYNTNQYDIFFPFVVGKNVKYNPYQNTFVDISLVKKQKEIKRQDRLKKIEERKEITKQKEEFFKEKVKELRKQKVITKRQERKMKRKEKKETAKDKNKTTLKTVLQIPQTEDDINFGIHKYKIKYNPYFKGHKFKIGEKKKQKKLDTTSIFEDVQEWVDKQLATTQQGKMARIIIVSPTSPNEKNTFSTKISYNPSVEEIRKKIFKVIDSNEEFDLGTAEITVKFYNVPQGEGGENIEVPKWLKDKSKSVFLIDNKDKLCGQRCLVLGMATPDRRKYLRKKEELFTKEAKRLATFINVENGMNFLDFEKFVDKYPQYKVSIVTDLNTILYETANNEYETELFLYYDKRIEHYHFINNIDGFFNDRNGHYKFCRTCRKRLEKRVYDKHKCAGLKCNLCGTEFKNEEEKKEHLTCKKSTLQCSNCNLKCRGDKCLDLHQNGNGKRKGCNSDQWFFDCCLYNGYNVRDCWGRQKDKEIHKCDHAYCKTCDEYKPRNHRCWIKPREHKDRGLQSLIAFDFESFIDNETGEHRVNYIVAKERSTNTLWEWEWEQGKDILKEFIDFVFTKPKTTFIAHNGKAYDTWLIHYYITKNYNERPTKIILAGQKIMYMEIKSVKFIDSINHFACKLEDVPRTFGLDENQFKKGFYPYTFNTKENWDYEGNIPDIKYFNPCSMIADKRLDFFKWWYDKKQNNYIWKHKKETKEYCISDVDILLQGCNVYSQEGMDLVGIDPLDKKTIAGWVMDIYLKKFYDFDLTPICVLNKNEYDFIRKSFHGGRTETFRLYRKWSKNELAEGKCGRYKDVQSLYPTTQYYDPLPIGEPKWIDKIEPNNYHNYINTHYGWFEVDIEMNKELFIPPLVSKGEGKLTADLIDKNKQVFHSVELRKAIQDNCKITKIHNGLIMDNSTHLFKDFVRTFLEVKVNATGKPKIWDSIPKREKWIKEHEDRFGFTPQPTEKNAGKRAIAKMILNSLWGKFGQRPDMPKNKYIPPDKVYQWFKMLRDNIEGKIEIRNEELSGDTLFVNYLELDDKKNDTLKTTSIAIASSVTASATMRLYKELRLLKERVLYCDTDSIIYEDDYNKYNIPDGKFLGEWECETDGLPITEFVSTGAKSYAYKVQGRVKDCKMKGITLNWENSKDINFNTLKKLVDCDTEKLTTKQNIRFEKNKEKGITTFSMNKDIKFTMDKREVKGYWTYPYGYEGNKYN